VRCQPFTAGKDYPRLLRRRPLGISTDPLLLALLVRRNLCGRRRLRGCQPFTAGKDYPRLLRRHPEVKRAIEARLEPDTIARISAELEVTVENVLRDILETRDRAAEMGDNAQRNKANELLGRHLGMWVEKKEVNVSATAVFAQRYAEAEARAEEYRKNRAALEGEFDLPGGDGLQLAPAPEPEPETGEFLLLQAPEPEPEPAKNAQEKFEELQSGLKCPVVPRREYEKEDWVDRLVRRSGF